MADALPCQRSAFELPSTPIYLNGASRSPLLRATREAGQEAVALKTQPWRIKSQAALITSIKSMYSDIVVGEAGGGGATIALQGSTSSALSNVARNLALGPGEKVLVLEAQNHSNVMPWQSTPASLHVVRRPADGSFDWTREILAVLAKPGGGGVRVVALPHCHWTDGSMIDLEAVGKRCRELGNVLLVADLSQSAGAMPFDNRRIGAAFIATSVHKWLTGPYGMCLLHCDPGLTSEASWQPQDQHDRNRAPPPGLSAAALADFHSSGPSMRSGHQGYPTAFVSGGSKFDLGGRPNPIVVPMLHKALSHVHRWGAARVADYCAPLSRRIAACGRRLGFVVPPWHAPHIVGLRAPSSASSDWPSLSLSLGDVVQELLETEGISVSLRLGAIRVSVHVYNTEEEVAHFERALPRIMERLRMRGKKGQAKL